MRAALLRCWGSWKTPVLRKGKLETELVPTLMLLVKGQSREDRVADRALVLWLGVRPVPLRWES